MPQVYAKLKKGDLSGDGALLGGRDVSLAALNDIRSVGGQIRGGDSVSLSAGRDIVSETTTRGDGANRWIDRPAGIYLRNAQGNLTLSALNNITLTGSDIANSGAGGNTRIAAGNDLRLETLSTARTEIGDWGGGNWRHLTQQRDVGSRIAAAGDLQLSAGRDISATAAEATAGGALTAQAGRDIALNAGTAATDLTEHSKQSSRGFLSASSTETHDEVHDRQALSSTLSGQRIALLADDNLRVKGSAIVADNDIVLQAGRDVTTEAATEQHAYYSMSRSKKSGVFSGGDLGVTLGSQSARTEQRGTDMTESDSRSVIGTSGGNVIIHAGNQVTLSATDIVAARSQAITVVKAAISTLPPATSLCCPAVITSSRRRNAPVRAAA